MERFSTTFLVAAVLTFLLGFFLQGVMPVLTLRDVPVRTLEQISQNVTPDFEQLALDYPVEFKRDFGTVGPESFAQALDLGRDLYIAEACWHCHSQQVRPISNEDIRFGRVSNAREYQNEMNLPHLFGTRRIGPDLIREAGKHSNDWQMAHLYEPRSVAPYSIMPGYVWYFDDDRRPEREALALVAYVQWLGSWGGRAMNLKKVDSKFAIIFVVTVLVMVVAGMAFVYKMTEFAMTITDDDVSGFGPVSLAVYLLGMLPLLLLTIWAALSGRLRDVEGPKYRMLELNKDIGNE